MKKKRQSNRKPSARPSVHLKNINDISAGPSEAPGVTHLHPNFVEGRKKTQFKTGVSGNPGGRRKPLIRDVLSELAMTVHERDVSQRTYLQLIGKALFQEAMRGSVPAAKELFDRLEGRPVPFNPAIADQGDRLHELVRAVQHPLYELALEKGIDEEELMTIVLGPDIYQKRKDEYRQEHEEEVKNPVESPTKKNTP